jgi:hypothetical protein
MRFVWVARLACLAMAGIAAGCGSESGGALTDAGAVHAYRRTGLLVTTGGRDTLSRSGRRCAKSGGRSSSDRACHQQDRQHRPN